MLHPRQVLTRSMIFERVWEYDFGPTSNSLTVYIGYLRRKLEEGGRAAPVAHGAWRRLRLEGMSSLRKRVFQMSFSDRVILLSAAAVAAAVVLASGIIFVVVRGELRGQVDDQLQELVQDVQSGRGSTLLPKTREASSSSRPTRSERSPAMRRSCSRTGP